MHTSIYACTLPTWISDEKVDSMIKHFGGLLRDELINFISTAQSKRRSGSTGSQRLSIDSDDESLDEIINSDDYVETSRVARGVV